LSAEPIGDPTGGSGSPELSPPDFQHSPMGLNADLDPLSLGATNSAPCYLRALCLVAGTPWVAPLRYKSPDIFFKTIIFFFFEITFVRTYFGLVTCMCFCSFNNFPFFLATFSFFFHPPCHLHTIIHTTQALFRLKPKVLTVESQLKYGVQPESEASTSSKPFIPPHALHR
jgi:hypothetical protein